MTHSDWLYKPFLSHRATNSSAYGNHVLFLAAHSRCPGWTGPMLKGNVHQLLWPVSLLLFLLWWPSSKTCVITCLLQGKEWEKKSEKASKQIAHHLSKTWLPFTVCSAAPFDRLLPGKHGLILLSPVPAKLWRAATLVPCVARAAGTYGWGEPDVSFRELLLGSSNPASPFSIQPASSGQLCIPPRQSVHSLFRHSARHD